MILLTPLSSDNIKASAACFNLTTQFFLWETGIFGRGLFWPKSNRLGLFLNLFLFQPISCLWSLSITLENIQKSQVFVDFSHCVKSVRIRSYSGPCFPTFGLNTERYWVSLRIQSECGKMPTRITPNRTPSTQWVGVEREQWREIS